MFRLHGTSPSRIDCTLTGVDAQSRSWIPGMAKDNDAEDTATSLVALNVSDILARLRMFLMFWL